MYNSNSWGARYAGNFGFSIDGLGSPAYCRKVDPGRFERAAYKHHQGGNVHAPSSLAGKLKHTPIKADVSLGMSRGVTEWLNEAFRKNPTPKNGKIVECDQNFRSVRMYEFFNAFLTEVTFPAFDANSGDGLYLSLTLQPEWVEVHELPGGGRVEEVEEGANKAINFTCGNYRFEIQGSDDLAPNVVKVDSFTFKANVKEVPTSANPRMAFCPVNFEMPELSVTYNEPLNPYFDRLAREFLAEGNCSAAKHLWADLEFMDIANKRQLGEVRFDRMGITKSPTQSYDASGQNLSQNAVSIYCAEMQLKVADADA